MARWKVTQVERGPGRRIVGLFGPTMGYRSTAEVIADLDSGSNSYFVKAGPYESEVKAVGDGEERTVFTTKNILSPNHLENLSPLYRGSRLFR